MSLVDSSLPFDPNGRKYHRSSVFGKEVVSHAGFLKRPGIVWQWRMPLFDGNVWGTKLGDTHCFLSGGLHDLSHAIDFVMCGRTKNITRDGLLFNRKWARKEYITGFGWVDDEPKSSQAVRSEIRTFALQAMLMERETGDIYDILIGHERDCAEEAGYLKDICEPRPSSENGWAEVSKWYRDGAVLVSCSIEEYALDKGGLTVSPGFDDIYFWMREKLGTRNYDNHFKSLGYKEQEKQRIEMFADDVIKHYHRYKTNPFTQKRVSEALTTVASRTRAFQRANNFQFNPDIHIGYVK